MTYNHKYAYDGVKIFIYLNFKLSQVPSVNEVGAFSVCPAK